MESIDVASLTYAELIQLRDTWALDAAALSAVNEELAYREAMGQTEGGE